MGWQLANRARFGLDLTRRVKAAVLELAVIYRLTVDDFFPEGLQREEGLTHYRLGLGRLSAALLNTGMAHWPLLR